MHLKGPFLSAMRIFRHYEELPAAVRGGVVALGNFDGVHLGHQAVIGRALDLAKRLGAPAGVMTFEPHPRSVFSPDQPPFRLTPFRIKARLIEALSVDFLLMQHFDKAFAAHSAEGFIEEVLIKGLGVRAVVVGYDFCFGRGRAGSVEMLRGRSDFETVSVDAQGGADGQTYSSNLIRQFLLDGKPDIAARLLGRPWEIEGRVETGDQRGRTIGFPTANLHLGDYMRPAIGVYAVRAGIDQGSDTVWHDGVANLGRRPTFDKQDVILEAHLFDFDGDLYGRHLRVALSGYIRAERKFDGLPALKAQIAEDCDTARALLSEVPNQ
jgi:riboflavin kinase/FMN adenylyltransferase